MFIFITDFLFFLVLVFVLVSVILVVLLVLSPIFSCPFRPFPLPSSSSSLRSPLPFPFILASHLVFPLLFLPFLLLLLLPSGKPFLENNKYCFAYLNSKCLQCHATPVITWIRTEDVNSVQNTHTVPLGILQQSVLLVRKEREWTPEMEQKKVTANGVS